MSDKALKISFVVFIMVFILIFFALFWKKEDEFVNIIEEGTISDEMANMIATHQKNAVKSIPVDKSSYPLVVGSDGENVKRLQKALGIKEDGILNQSVMNDYKLSLSNVPKIKDLDKITESSIILIEEFAKPNVRVKVGDSVYASKPMRLTSFKKFQGIDLSGKGNIVPFGEKEEIGVVKEIKDNVAVVEGKGLFFVPRVASIQKK